MIEPPADQHKHSTPGDLSSYPAVRQGVYGEYTITRMDWWRGVLYRASLTAASLSFITGGSLILYFGLDAKILAASNILFTLFTLGLGISILAIRIYFLLLHRLLLILWLIGVIAAVAIALKAPAPLFVTLYEQPAAQLGISFLFASLTGIFIKEAFCHEQIEAILLVPLVPALFVLHANDLCSVTTERLLLGSWLLLYLIFVVRKFFQPMEPEIGDKTVMAKFRGAPLPLANSASH